MVTLSLLLQSTSSGDSIQTNIYDKGLILNIVISLDILPYKKQDEGLLASVTYAHFAQLLFRSYWLFVLFDLTKLVIITFFNVEIVRFSLSLHYII